MIDVGEGKWYFFHDGNVQYLVNQLDDPDGLFCNIKSREQERYVQKNATSIREWSVSLSTGGSRSLES